jgi:protein SCO1/2
VQHQIPKFAFTNQDSVVVTNEDLDDYIYVADFFFISCPSICPKVKKQMLRIYDAFEDEDQLKLVSHTIDPKRDTERALKLYAGNLNVDTDKWIFLTGDKDELFDQADQYFVAAFEDSEAPGGFDHSGKILLVDKQRHIRAFADGTDEDSVTEFLKDIKNLLNEYKT